MRSLFILSFTLSAPLLLSGAAITGISLTNNSTASFTDTSDPLVRKEFRTLSAVPLNGTTNGNTASFTTRMSWFSGHQVLPGGESIPQTHSAAVAYDLVFTVDDPLSQGYSLEIGNVIRGFVSAYWESNTSAFPSLVFAAGTLMVGSIDTGSGFVLAPELATEIEVATANPTTPLVNELVFREDTLAAGTFFGTRTFRLQFSTLPNNAVAGLQNLNTGEGAVRFGLQRTLVDGPASVYPGGDGETPDTHGHFVTVRATFLDAGDAAPVPEPSSAALTFAGLLAAALICAVWRPSSPSGTSD